jgi:hypothetical protein
MFGFKDESMTDGFDAVSTMDGWMKSAETLACCTSPLYVSYLCVGATKQKKQTRTTAKSVKQNQLKFADLHVKHVMHM